MDKKISRKRDTSGENKEQLLSLQDNSVWDPEKGRARKVTEKYLGRVTQDGIIKPKHERILEGLNDITVKEFGASHFINSISSKVVELLKENYPTSWK